MGLFQFSSQFLSDHFPANSLRERFARGMVWIVAGSSLRQGANFVAGVIVARMLGIVDFGTLAVIQSTVLMLTGFGQAGIGLSSTRHVAATRSSDRERAGRIIGFSLAFAVVMALVMGAVLVLQSSRIAGKLLPGSDIALPLSVASIWFMFEMLNIVQIRILAGLEAFSLGARINLWQAVFLLPVVIVGAYVGKLSGAIISFAFISLIGCVIGQHFIRKQCESFKIRITYRGAWRERVILRMSLMVWLSGIAMNATNWFAGILLARQPMGVAEYALFNAAQRFQNVIVFIPSRISHVSVPILSNLQAMGRKAGFRKAVLGAVGFGTAVTAGLALPVIVFADLLMSWYGAEFSRGQGVLVIVAVTSCISSVWTIASAGMWAAEQSGRMFLLDVFRGGLLVTLCIIGMAADARGLALAHLLSYAAGTALLLIALLRCTGKAWNRENTLEPDTRPL